MDRRESTVVHRSAGLRTPLQLAVAALAVCALTVAAYIGNLDNGFVWDDHEQVVMNPYVRGEGPLLSAFTSDVRFMRERNSVQTKAYRPLQMITYRVVMDVCGDSALAFHAVSIGFAAAGAVAALLLFWLLTAQLGVAFAAAAFFAVHPVHTEAVDWIAALPDLGVGLMMMVTLALWLAARRSGQRKRRWVWHGVSILAFLAALLWKETALVLPLLILLYALLGPGQQDAGAGMRVRRALRQSAEYWAVLAAYLLLRYAALGPLTAGTRVWGLTETQYTATILQLMIEYWAKLLLPVDLNAYRVLHPAKSVATVAVAASALAVIAGLAGWVYLVRRSPLAGFAALWVGVTLLPALNLSALGRNAFAERYLYVASAGYCLLAALAAAWLVGHLKVRYQPLAGASALLVVLGCCTTATYARTAVWKDDATLFGETLNVSPDAPFIRIMVANEQSVDPLQFATAEENYKKAVALAEAAKPVDRVTLTAGYQGLASLYAGRGEMAHGLAALDEARQVVPEAADLALQREILLTQSGQGAEAEPALRRALTADPNNENILSALGLIDRDVHHDLKSAANLFKMALGAHPQLDDFNAAQHSNLAGVYADADNPTAAIAEMRQAVAIAPRDPEYHDNLASALAAAGRFQEARTEAQTALELAPGDPMAREILGKLVQR